MPSSEEDLGPWRHHHTFGQQAKKPGEVRTLAVVILTAATMVLEIVAGSVYGSMALLADGLHMASHTAALAIAMFAYVYARRRAHDGDFTFGTGKVNSLAGFSGAILLALFALLMAWESILRLVHPIEIAFDQALIVAFVGLLVNGLSILLLNHGDAHHREHELEHEHESEAAQQVAARRPADGSAQRRHHDHNLRAAYLHVLADALTSLLALVALLAGKYLGLTWLDPVIGIVGAVLVARWSAGLLRTTSHVLLDRQGPSQLVEAIRRNVVTEPSEEVVDLHLWAVGPGSYALILSLVADCPRTPKQYRERLPRHLHLDHVTIEVWPRNA